LWQIAVGAFALPSICHNNNLINLTANQEAVITILINVAKRIKAEKKQKETNQKSPLSKKQ
jgi:Fe2+ or Zn2+ uptake regulation protein